MRRVTGFVAFAVVLAITIGACGSGSPAPPAPAEVAVGERFPGTLPSPGCTHAVSLGAALDHVPATLVRVPSSPSGAVSTRDGRWSFLTLGHQLGVLSNAGGVPRLVRLIDLPGAPVAATLTHDGRYLLLSDGAPAVVVSVARAEQGSAHPVLGALPGASGAIAVTTSPGDAYAFVTLEARRVIAVFDLRAALARGFHGAGYVGAIPLGIAPLGIAISPDGRWIYATSELAAHATGPQRRQGTLSVIDVRRAETRPSGAVVRSAAAGCGTARVTVSPDGRTVWVSARRSNAVLGYSAAKLHDDPAHALLAVVAVGDSPVGLGFVDGSRRLVVSDSGPDRTLRRTAGLTVLDPSAAAAGRSAAGRSALIGTIPAGPYPREMTFAPTGQTLLVARFASGRVEVLHAADLP